MPFDSRCVVLALLTLSTACGFRAAPLTGARLEASLERCIDDNWKFVGGQSASGGSTSASSFYDWKFDVESAPAEGDGVPAVAQTMAKFRADLIALLEGQGCNVHGRGLSGLPEAPVGFHLEYTLPAEEGVVWCYSVPSEPDKTTILIVWHSAATR
ncbi:MAG: hypothetical protein VYE77_01085 [Planctomycetota bacterium]|nr:hypothetical protein [Planctomycetota bacterium]